MLGYLLCKLKLKSIFLLSISLAVWLYIYQIGIRDSCDNYPVILWWTPFMAENERIINCFSQYKCLLTKDRGYINHECLKAYLFYGSAFNFTDLPLPKKAVWALYHEESPRNVALFLYNRTYELFDITSTFSRYSDVPLTLQYLEKLSLLTDTQYTIDLKTKNELLSTLSPILYIQSDCDTPTERDAYVYELMKHIPVDSYGKCINNKKFPKEISELYPLDFYNGKILHFIAKYKFMIAFENAVCDDYITEKLWRPLMAGTVPIYLGSPTVQDWLPNRNSAILANNFQSPLQLAKYIRAINQNDTFYQTFLGHKRGKVENDLLKNTFAKGPFGIITDKDHSIPAFECFVCKSYYEGIKKKELKSVYDCPKPHSENSWKYHWQLGDCQSKALVNSVKNNVKLKTDPC